MEFRIKAQLICDALTMAIWKQQPKAERLVHSDQVVQDANYQYHR